MAFNAGVQSSILFEPDTILPAQFYVAFRGGSNVRGEKRLMLAVLQDALDCYQKYWGARGFRGKDLFRDAEQWIMDNDRRWPFSFENICEMLEISPEYLRRGVKEWSSSAERERRPGLLRRTNRDPASALYS